MEHENESVEHSGTYLVIEPPARLSFTWISPYTDMLPSIVTVELQARGEGTELVLTHERLPARHVEAHRKGWGDILRNWRRRCAAPATCRATTRSALGETPRGR